MKWTKLKRAVQNDDNPNASNGGGKEPLRPFVLVFLALFVVSLLVLGLLQWRFPNRSRVEVEPLPSLEEFFESANLQEDPFAELDRTTLGTAELVNEEVEIFTRDGQFISARVSKPVGDGPFPVMVIVHGVDSSSQITNQVSLLYGKRFASELNMIVVVVDWRDSTIGEEDFIDVISTLEWSEGVVERETQPTIAFGMDRGAYLAIKAQNEVRTDGIVSAYGYVDLLEQYQYLQEYNTDTAALFLEETGCSTVVDSDGCLRQLSLTDTLNITSPTLVLHGADDTVTPPLQSELLRDAIDPAVVQYELLDGATEEERVEHFFDGASVVGHDAAIDILYQWLEEQFDITSQL